MNSNYARLQLRMWLVFLLFVCVVFGSAKQGECNQKFFKKLMKERPMYRARDIAVYRYYVSEYVHDKLVLDDSLGSLNCVVRLKLTVNPDGSIAKIDYDDTKSTCSPDERSLLDQFMFTLDLMPFSKRLRSYPRISTTFNLFFGDADLRKFPETPSAIREDYGENVNLLSELTFDDFKEIIYGQVLSIDGDYVTIKLHVNDVETINGSALSKFMNVREGIKERDRDWAERTESEKIIVRKELSKDEYADELQYLDEYIDDWNKYPYFPRKEPQMIFFDGEDVIDFKRDARQSVLKLMKMVDDEVVVRSIFFLYDEDKLVWSKSMALHVRTSQGSLEALDTDGDGVPNSIETCSGLPDDCIESDPNKLDTDGDGWWDSLEGILKTDPTDPEDTPELEDAVRL